MKFIIATGLLTILTFASINPLVASFAVAQASLSETTQDTLSEATQDNIVATAKKEESVLPKTDLSKESSDKKNDLDAQKLLEFIDSLRGYGQQGFSFELSNVSYKHGEIKQRNTLVIQVLNEHSLVEYLTPARQKGRKILKQGRNMWLHLPGTRNILRITPAQRLLGEASNGDVTGTTFSQDYTVTFLGAEQLPVGSEQLQKQKVHKLELIAKHRKTAYQKVIFYLNAEDQMPLRSDFYSRSGRLLKQAEYKEFKLFDGTLKVHKMLLSDPIKKGSFTWMMFDNYQTKDIDSVIFHKDAISR